MKQEQLDNIVEYLGLQGEVLPPDFEGTLAYLAREKVDSRAAYFFFKHFEQDITFEQIGREEQPELTRARVQQLVLKVKEVLVDNKANRALLLMGLEAGKRQEIDLEVRRAADAAYSRVSNNFLSAVRKILSDGVVGNGAQYANPIDSIEVLSVSNRTYRCLKLAGYTTVAEIISGGKQKLMNIPNFGVKCYEEVVTQLVGSYGEFPSNWVLDRRDKR